MPGNLRGFEWVILLAIVLLLFGARRLPDLARSVGRSMKIFRSEVKDLRSDDVPAGGTTPGAVPPVTPTAAGARPTIPTIPTTVDTTRDDSEPRGS